MISWVIQATSWPKWKKGPLSHQKMKYSFLHYVQLLMIGWLIWVTKVKQNAKKRPLSHWKMKCSFLDYIQLLIICQMIRVMKVDWNTKKGPLSHRKIKCSLHSTSDDHLSDKSWPKCKKRPPKSSKNEMLIFGLCSTSDDRPSDLSNESLPKCKKRPLSHQKMKCSF